MVPEMVSGENRRGKIKCCEGGTDLEDFIAGVMAGVVWFYTGESLCDSQNISQIEILPET